MDALPKVPDDDAVLKLARLGCTNEEIGDFFGVSRETIRVKFLHTLALGRAEQKISLRRHQWKSARGGNVPMQIHLGKQCLGQSDKVDHRGAGGSALFPATSQQAALGDPQILEEQYRLDERLIAPEVLDAGRLRDGGEPGQVGDDAPPGIPESQTD